MIGSVVDLQFLIRRLQEVSRSGLLPYVVDSQGRLVAAASGNLDGLVTVVGVVLGIIFAEPMMRVYTETPHGDKVRAVEELERQGERVMMVGDGTNDGPALARATVGVSIGSRANTVALETADVVLMRDGLAGLPFLTGGFIFTINPR